MEERIGWAGMLPTVPNSVACIRLALPSSQTHMVLCKSARQPTVGCSTSTEQSRESRNTEQPRALNEWEWDTVGRRLASGCALKSQGDCLLIALDQHR